MAQTYRARFLAIVRRVEQELEALFAGLSAFAIAELLRNAGEDDMVPLSASLDVRTAITAQVIAAFLYRTGRGLEPFTVAGGIVRPLSPYARILQAGIEDAIAVPVEQHATIMARELQGAPDVLAGLRAPGQSARLVAYDPPHLWVDPNGYRLSDRIWRTADATRRKLDRFLEEGIAQGRGARSMARELEAFLQPGRELVRTNTPYGTDASYDAMRLARTEISRAHARSAEQAALANPFVSGLIWNLSGSHPKPDICDDNAAGSPYPLDDHPMMPAHPNCLCHWTYGMAEDRGAVVERLRTQLRSASITPLQQEQFKQALMRG